MATIAEDTFPRSNRSLDGDTMSDGSSTWALGANSGWSIFSFQGRSDAANAIQYCDSMADTADIRVRLINQDAGVGAAARYDSAANNFYVANRAGNNKVKLFRSDGLSFTQLGSDGSAIASGETVAVVCDGESISAEYEGTLDVGPITDANYSTGKAAMHASSSGKDVDDFFAESLATPSVNLESTANTTLLAQQVAQSTAQTALANRATKGITAQSILLARSENEVTANSVLLSTQTVSSIANTTLLSVLSQSITVNTVLASRQTNSVTAQAILASRTSLSALAQTTLLSRSVASITATTYLSAVARTAGIRANAVILAAVQLGVTAGATVLARRLRDVTATTIIASRSPTPLTAITHLTARNLLSVVANAEIFNASLGRMFIHITETYDKIVISSKADSPFIHERLNNIVIKETI